MNNEQSLSNDSEIRIALRDSELRLQSVVNSARMVLWAVDRDGRFTFSDGAGLGTPARQTGFRAQAARTGGLEARFIPRRNARVQASSTQRPQVWFPPSPQVM